jgi:transcriptional regulator with XRE-family HTH domain
MEDLRPTIAKNIIELRKSMNLTQAELTQRMNYSDKAVSKWPFSLWLKALEK